MPINYKPIVITGLVALVLGALSGAVGTVQYLGLDFQAIKELREQHNQRVPALSDYPDLQKELDEKIAKVEAETQAKIAAHEAQQRAERRAQWPDFFVQVRVVFAALLICAAAFAVYYVWQRRRLDHGLAIHKEFMAAQRSERTEKAVN